jgi:hypothetical protein
MGKPKPEKVTAGIMKKRRCHHSLLLSGGDRRDEESDAQHAEQKQNCKSTEGNLEPERSDGRDQRDIEQSDQEEGPKLCQLRTNSNLRLVAEARLGNHKVLRTFSSE